MAAIITLQRMLVCLVHCGDQQLVNPYLIASFYRDDSDTFYRLQVTQHLLLNVRTLVICICVSLSRNSSLLVAMKLTALSACLIVPRVSFCRVDTDVYAVVV